MSLFLFLACGADEPSSSDTGPAATSPLTTGSPEDSVSTPTDTGWACNPWYPCQECGGVYCLSEISSCAAVGACGGALNLWAQCVLACGDPEVCAATFEEDGGPEAAELLTCTVGSCAAECDL